MKSDQHRVLVVDDNQTNRDVLSRRLRRQHIAVETAVHGLQALELVRARSFDLVLLDIMMPEMNGYQVLEHLKADPQLRHIPVIMISAVDDIESVVRCIELGAEDYLLKPFNPVLLRARIDASLEKKHLRDQERAYIRMVQQELELGRRTQADFFPAHLPQPPGWHIASFFRPAREVAGDFYDAFVLPCNRMGLVIADVCDKGVGAALFMVMVRSLLRAFAEQTPPAAIDTLALDTVQQTSAYITRHHHYRPTRRPMFATLFFGVLDTTTGALTYINAGHAPPVLIRHTGSHTLLEPTGPAVGLMPDLQFAQGQVHFEVGDTLIAYTDGITEARAADNALFGEARLFALLNTHPASASTLIDTVHYGVHAHSGGEPPADDMTMLAVQRLVEPTVPQ
jgi:serine phosphatase RsbU (regulator of sigma subunit)